ncbi:hypothetical protein [Clostridium nigeriense]|uniref:hypothetical protein n=1 Tax=Clostridium nigeriense TaxID=1805470 RepID=UPI00082D6DBE|nr:hypothetical protein [Clostridium nigeriense]
MKKSKIILFIILGIFIFLICDKIRISYNFAISSKIENINTNIDIKNLIDYINNLDLTEEDIEEISEKSKSISEDIKGKTSFKEYKLKEILKIYKNFSVIANSLNLKIDFSIKNGDFTLKEKANGTNIFSGNVSDIKKYFQAIKDNTNISTLEVLASIDSEEILDNIDSNINNTDKEKLNNEDLNNNKNDIVENETNSENINKDLLSSKNSINMVIPISILVIAFCVIVISYIKFK